MTIIRNAPLLALSLSLLLLLIVFPLSDGFDKIITGDMLTVRQGNLHSPHRPLVTPS
jgi:hypothetical protein